MSLNYKYNNEQGIYGMLHCVYAAASVTFIRFFPRMKARYDYGLLIFILTFCLISVSGYRDEEILEMAHKRASTILIGAFIAVFACVFICPVWAGDDLHNSVAKNIEKLGSFLEGMLSENTVFHCWNLGGISM